MCYVCIITDYLNVQPWLEWEKVVRKIGVVKQWHSIGPWFYWMLVRAMLVSVDYLTTVLMVIVINRWILLAICFRIGRNDADGSTLNLFLNFEFYTFFVLFPLINLSFLIIFPNPNQLMLLQTLLLLNYSSWCFHRIVLKRCGPFCDTNTYAKFYVNYDKIADWMKLRPLKFVF